MIRSDFRATASLLGTPCGLDLEHPIFGEPTRLFNKSRDAAAETAVGLQLGEVLLVRLDDLSSLEEGFGNKND